MKKLFSVAIGLFFLSLCSTAQALTLDVRNGVLYGAKGVLVGATRTITPTGEVFNGGTSYDVEFVEGTCVQLFNGCNDTSDFAFTTELAAATASRSLLEQVFGSGEFDDYADRTNGISYPHVGFLVTAWGSTGSLVEKVFAENFSLTGLSSTDRINTNARNININSNSGSFGDDWVYARWTATPEVSAVPLPAALPLYGAGLAVLGFMGWRKKRSAQQS